MPRFRGVLALAFSVLAPSAWAQDVRDAETLPKGVGALIIAPVYSGGTDRFGPRWHFLSRESILADYAGLELTQVIAGNPEGAQTIETLIGGLGTTNFRASQTSVGINFTLAYGITDRWTVAALIPFSHTTYELDAWLQPTNKTDADGNAIMQSHYGVKDPSLIQCPTGDLQIQDPQDLLTRVLEDREDQGYTFNVGDLRKALTSACLGYKDPMDSVGSDSSDGLLHGTGTRTYTGFRDIVLGTKYKFWNTEHLRLAGTFYVVTPAGRPDDPDDLFDPAFGDGQWDSALIAQATTVWGPFRASLATAYEVQFGDTITRRLFGLSFSDDLEGQLARNEISEADLYADHLDDGQQVPLVTAYEKARVSRKLGDNIYVQSMFSYDFTEWLSATITLDFLHHFRDELKDTGTRIADGSRLKTSAEIRAEVDQLVASGQIAPENKIAELRARLPESAERKAASYAWHTVRNSIVLGAGIGFNTLKPFVRDEFPLPLIIGFSAAIPVAGKNIDALDSFGFTLVVPFAFGDVKDPAEYGYDDEENGGLPWP